MNYYKDTSDKSRRWAWVALLLYLLLMALILLFARLRPAQQPVAAPILVEFALEERPKPQPQVTPKAPQMHREVAPEEQTEPVHGPAEETRTVNPKALFRQSQSGVDEPENAGNPQAETAEEDRASGEGSGMAPDGFDQLDKGLQGRGLVGDLPKPHYSSDAEGRVVIRVTVDRTGRVTAAAYEPQGSTTSHPTLIREAQEAAMQARFTESRSFVQGGTITYVFTLKR